MTRQCHDPRARYNPAVSSCQGWGVSDVGRKREVNEDSFLVDDALGLYLVADGMGGHAGGAFASRAASTAFRDEFRQRTADPLPDDGEQRVDAIAARLLEAITVASVTVFERALVDPSLAGMGTTLSAMHVEDGKAFVVHVGDSRVYLARDRTLTQVSEDHSLVSDQLKVGLLTPEEARTSPLRNVITRSVGFSREVEPDLYVVPIEPGDRFLLCSDGLTLHVDPREILLGLHSTLMAKAPWQLIDLALSRGGEDNVTVVTVYCP
jgi:PPM family protein phosphatase